MHHCCKPAIETEDTVKAIQEIQSELSAMDAYKLSQLCYSLTTRCNSSLMTQIVCRNMINKRDSIITMQIKEQSNLTHISIHKILPYATQKQKKLEKNKKKGKSRKLLVSNLKSI